MTTVESFVAKYSSVTTASVGLEVHRTQLDRWIASGALVDKYGGVWIRTKGCIIEPNENWPIDSEKRMPQIMQNGNTGDHYEK